MTALTNEVVQFVKNELKNAEGGHDWWHVYRVWKNALKISEEEHIEGDLQVIEPAALLHDIADAKFNDENEETGVRKAEAFLANLDLTRTQVEHILNIIRYISFKGGFNEGKFDSIEFRIVQDADRLDALGAIGIARTFNYGGYKNRPIFDPEILPQNYNTKEGYNKSNAPTINHFYEKLLKLKESFKTTSGKRLAEERHQFMLIFLGQFYEEWPDSILVDRFQTLHSLK